MTHIVAYLLANATSDSGEKSDVYLTRARVKLRRLLKIHGNNRTKAAAAEGVSYRTFTRWLRKAGFAKDPGGPRTL